MLTITIHLFRYFTTFSMTNRKNVILSKAKNLAIRAKLRYFAALSMTNRENVILSKAKNLAIRENRDTSLRSV